MYCLTLNYLNKFKIMQNVCNKIKINNIYKKQNTINNKDWIYNKKTLHILRRTNCDFSKLKKISDYNNLLKKL